MFNVKNGKVSIARERKLTARQLSHIARMNPNDKAAYISTLLGISKRRVWVDRRQNHEPDHLALKDKNSVLRQLSQLTSLENTHRPSQVDLGEWVGVEIECFLPSTVDGDVEGYEGEDWDDEEVHIDAQTAKARLREALREARVKRVNIKHDGSLSSDHGYGIELTILVNTKYGWGDLEKLCKALAKCRAFVNRTCGLHVHFDARAMGKRGAGKFGRSIGAALPILSQMLPASRRSNHYCRMGVSKFTGDRYYAVNLTAFSKYRTVEIRMHSGTTDFKKIRNWIEILQAVGTAELSRETHDMQTLIDRAGLPERLVEYIERRTAEFSNPNADQDAA